MANEFRKMRYPVGLLIRCINLFVRAHLTNGRRNKKLLMPFMGSFYLTTKCNFGCVYCDDGSGNGFPSLPDSDRLNTEQTLRVLELLRKACPAINITGGEPTMRPDIERIMEHVEELGFYPVSLNTNAYQLDRYMAILKNVNFVSISIDSLDAERNDALIDNGESGQTEKILRNIEAAKQYRTENKLQFKVIINTVLLPETLDDAWDVLEYSLENNFIWCPMPHIKAIYPNPGLIDNPRWHELIDEAIRLKKKGANILASVTSLKHIKNFARYECHPTLRPVVYPNGDFYYPCPPLNTVACNLLEADDYHQAIEIGEEKHGPVPYCDSRCHLGCYMEASLGINYPFMGLYELLRYLIPKRGQVTLNRPLKRSVTTDLPTLQDLLAMPSFPPDRILELRKQGMLENDFTSRVRIKEENVRVN